MSEEERKFLEVRGLAKSFGTGDTKQDVLKQEVTSRSQCRVCTCSET